MNLAEAMRDKISKGLECQKLIVREEGQACSNSFTVVVVSDSFDGKGPLDRQRLVNAIIADEIKQLHAITLKTWTTKQWEAQKANYPEDQ